MKKYTRVCLFLITIIVVSLFTPYVLAKNVFSDVKEDSWYYDSVSYVYEKNLMNGMGDNRFYPGVYVTRGMIVTVLHRMEKSPKSNGALVFSDVSKNAYYYLPTAWATEKNIVTGFEDATFRPDNNITREQLAVFLYRYVKSIGKNISTSASLSAFADAEGVSSYAKDAMCWAYAEGLITGITSEKLDPRGYATRAQVATVFMRLDELLTQKTPTPTIPATPKPALPDTTKEDNEPTFSVSDAEISTGDKVDVVVSVKNNPGILGMTLAVEYDSNALVLTSSENGEALESLNFQSPKKYKSGCRFVWYGESIEENEITDGPVLKLSFEVSDTASVGEYPIKISYSDGDIIDTDLNSVSMKIVNSTIKVK